MANGYTALPHFTIMLKYFLLGIANAIRQIINEQLILPVASTGDLPVFGPKVENSTWNAKKVIDSRRFGS